MKQFRHACQMVWRNRKSYALLSVTVVLTFSFLLGYLLYTDSSLYNRYKVDLQLDRNVVIFRGQDHKDSRMDIIHAKASAEGATKSYPIEALSYFEAASLPREDTGALLSYNRECLFIPSQVWGLYDLTMTRPLPLEIQWLDGEEHENVHLGKHEILMERTLFQLLELDQCEKPMYTLHMSAMRHAYFDGEEYVNTFSIEPVSFELEVVGVFDSAVVEQEKNAKTYDEYWGSTPDMYLYLSMALLDDIPEELRATMSHMWYEVYYTEAPEVALATAEKISATSSDIINFAFTYKLKDNAIEAVNNANRNKAIIAAALFVILGISLYSCFTNALKDRKFEIGVKRAIGASGWSIIRQFLYEGLLVMGADILLSVALITDVAIIYKYVLSHIPAMVERYNEFIIYLSPWSAGMFGLCALGLTVGFSLIFAWQSTQVQIVDYLKAE